MDDDKYILNQDYISDNEICMHHLIKDRFAGLSLEQAYNVIPASKGYLDEIGIGTSDCDDFY